MLQGGGNPAAMGGGQGLMTEKLYSNISFEFTQMQDHLWEAFDKDAIAADSEFMTSLMSIMREE